MVLVRRLPILAEIIINGTFVLFYSLFKANHLFFELNPATQDTIFQLAIWLVPLVIFFVLITNFLSQESIEDFIRNHVFSLIIFVPMLITWGDIEFVYWLSGVHLFSSLISLRDSKDSSSSRTNELAKNIGPLLRFKLSAAQIVLISWGMVTLAGTLLLLLPVSAPVDKQLSFIDALFISSSAISTTGLSTISTPDDLSLFGQVVVLVLIQIGGIGFMTLSSSLVFFTGKSISLKDKVVLQDILDTSDQSELFEMIFDILRYTITIEFIGGILLSLGFYQEGLEIDSSIWYGFFHSISSFCTAGFALFNNSIEDFSTNPLISLTLTFEAMLGGLGFIVMKELRMVMKKEKKIQMLSMHSKVILMTMSMLVLFGTTIIFFGEFLHTLDNLSLFDKLHVAFFQFVSAQSTSGFNSITISSMQTYSVYFLILIMFIGSSPGSTGGGIKITTLAILIQSVKTTLYGKDEVEFFERSLLSSTVVKAIAVTIISLFIVCFFIFLMVMLEPTHPFLSLTFEVLSAFGTVGLSLGITGSLSWAGKMAITIVMFIGRIGPLTMVLAIGEHREKAATVKFPKSKIMIG